jgi:hypothetical protein
MNPGIAPTGLFWTTAIPSNSVFSNPGAGHAVVQVRDIHIRDFGDLTNSLEGGPSVPATVSYEIQWFDVDDRVSIKNQAQGFAGEYVRNQAQMAWSAIVGDFSFVSDPASTSSSVFAELGHERNGSFFPNGQ